MEDEEKTQEQFIKDNKDLDEMIREFNSDVELDIRNIRDKAFLVSTIRAKWLAKFFKEKENLSRIKKAKSKILQKKISDSPTQSSLLRLKSESKISESDERIKKLNELEKATQDNIDFIERAFSILDGFNWQIRDTIELLKLQGV